MQKRNIIPRKKSQMEKIVKDSGQTFTESKRDPNFSQVKNTWW